MKEHTHRSAITLSLLGIALVFLIAAAGSQTLFQQSKDSGTFYVGQFRACDADKNGITACFDINSKCKYWAADGAYLPNCTQFNAIRAFQIMAILTGVAAVFFTFANFVRQTTGWMLKLGTFIFLGSTIALSMMTMIISTSEMKESLFANGNFKYGASFALNIVAWLFQSFGTIAFIWARAAPKSTTVNN